MTNHADDRPRRGATALVAVLAAATASAGCSVIGADSADDGGSAGGASGTVTLVTHDSFALPKALLRSFEHRTGRQLDVVRTGDAGTMVNQLVLTGDAPLGDAVFGIDNSFASRALGADILQPYASPAEPLAAHRFDVDGSDRLTPVDFGDVCMNVDERWFAERDQAPPRTLDDLTDPAYADRTVVSNPATSSPGLAFLLATVAAFGEDGWSDYWARLRENGLKVADSWSDAYFVDFSGSSGHGPRPVVLSYASSPPAEVRSGEATTRALLDTCFRQVEYAGVLAGAEDPDGARQLVDFLLSRPVQEAVPTSMYVYPVDPKASLPPTWRRFAPLAADPYTVAPGKVDANREDWIEQWTEVVVG